MKKERDGMHEKLRTSEAAVKDLTAMKDDIVKERDRLEEKLQEAEVAWKADKEALVSVQEQIARERDELSSAAALAESSAKTEVNTLRENISDLNAGKVRLEKELVEKRAEMKDLKMSKDDALKKCRSLEDELKSAQSTAAILRETNYNDLAGDLNTTRAELEAAKLSLEEATKSITNQQREESLLRSSLEQQKIQTRELTKRLEGVIPSQARQDAQGTTQEASLKARCAALEKENASIKNREEGLKLVLSERHLQISDLQNKLNASKVDDILRMEEELDAAKSQVEQVNAANKLLKTQIEEAKSAREEAEKAEDILRKKTISLAADLKRRQKTRAEEEQIEALQSKVKDQEEALMKILGDLAEANLKVDQLQGKRDGDDVIMNCAEHGELLKKIAELEASLLRRDDHAQEQERALQQGQTRISELEVQVHELTSTGSAAKTSAHSEELKRRDDRIAELEAEVKGLSDQRDSRLEEIEKMRQTGGTSITDAVLKQRDDRIAELEGRIQEDFNRRGDRLLEFEAKIHELTLTTTAQEEELKQRDARITDLQAQLQQQVSSTSRKPTPTPWSTFKNQKNRNTGKGKERETIRPDDVIDLTHDPQGTTGSGSGQGTTGSGSGQGATGSGSGQGTTGSGSSGSGQGTTGSGSGQSSGGGTGSSTTSQPLGGGTGPSTTSQPSGSGTAQRGSAIQTTPTAVPLVTQPDLERILDRRFKEQMTQITDCVISMVGKHTKTSPKSKRARKSKQSSRRSMDNEAGTDGDDEGGGNDGECTVAQRATFRDALYTFFSITKFDDAANLRVLSEEELAPFQDWDPLEPSAGPPPPIEPPYTADWDEIEGPYNYALYAKFCQRSKAKSFSDIPDDNRSYLFSYYLKKFRSSRNKQTPREVDGELESPEAFQKRSMDTMAAEAKRNRSNSRRHTTNDNRLWMANDLLENAQQQELYPGEVEVYENIVEVVTILGPEGMSSDESDPEDPHSFKVHKPLWRSPVVEPVFRFLDTALYMKLGKPGSSGRHLRKRVQTDIPSRRSVPYGKPINFYHKENLQKILPFNKKQRLFAEATDDCPVKPFTVVTTSDQYFARPIAL
ncbi:hypothetical protein CVT24_002257 [Panaeolus cyanescens]|uniref:Uncharacterized protein n=1 Tax=Panaeolus cyanescens TaxID=181874 RepID=A0A409YIG6_9AGAR|nr:hypothetical protein CVT24_002257 [Panaeolus cyanescens]